MTDTRTVELRQRFRTLHASGCFVIPNPWDVGSARLLTGLGFHALATTSSGFAWSTGRRDNQIAVDDALAHMYAIAAAVDVPVNADFEGGFAIEPEDVAANVSRAVENTAIAGLSIEDSTGEVASPLFDFALAVDRVAAAREDSRFISSPVVIGMGLIATKPGRGKAAVFAWLLPRPDHVA